MISAVKVGPGDTNKGIFVRIKRDGPGQGEVRVCSISPQGTNRAEPPRNIKSPTPLPKSTGSSKARTTAQSATKFPSHVAAASPARPS